jgi:exodeoxyribonuclease VIII
MTRQYLYDIPNHEYQAMPGISSSELRLLYYKSPYHYKYQQDNPYEDEYKKFYEQGSLIHSLLLEPDKVDSYLYTLPEHIKDFRTNEAKVLRDEALAEHKNVLLQKDYEEVVSMVETYKQNDLVRTYLSGGEAETSIFWTDTKTNIKCKCRPDYMNKSGRFLVDVKSTGDLDKFIKSVQTYRYHTQAAHYLNGTEFDTFYILALSKEPPYDVELFILGEDAIAEGRNVCRQGLATLRECLDSDTWPNKYGQQLQVIEWRKNEWQNPQPRT